MKTMASKVYNEGAVWKWKIKDDKGNVYIDDDDYSSREDAEKILKKVLENKLWEKLSKNFNIS